MKIEILKSAKGNDQKQKKTGQTPKTQVGPHAKRNKKKTKERKLPKDWRTTQPNMKQPPSFIYFFFKT